MIKFKKCTGFVLPLALITLAVLTVMSIGLSRMAKNHVNLAHDQLSEWQEEQIFHNTVQQLAFMFLTGQMQPNAYIWDGTLIPIDGRWLEFEGLRIKVQDVAGMLPLQPSLSELSKIFEYYVEPAEAQQLAATVVDWMDVDALINPGGMEAAEYLASGLAVIPRNGPMRTLEELLNIPGITRDNYYGDDSKIGLRDFFVLRKRGSSLNVATTPEPLLEILAGGVRVNTRALLRAREQEDWPELMATLSGIGFGDEFSLNPNGEFMLDAEFVSGRKARALIRLTPEGKQAFEILLWYFPDYERL
ncbi:MAG: general secretion pathway protein GspK [Gammaproteobacteria bacterium]|nr:general secretion pathway protein GspK [Gammaproteobacteria bacterium]